MCRVEQWKDALHQCKAALFWVHFCFAGPHGLGIILLLYMREKSVCLSMANFEMNMDIGWVTRVNMDIEGGHPE